MAINSTKRFAGFAIILSIFTCAFVVFIVHPFDTRGARVAKFIDHGNAGSFRPFYHANRPHIGFDGFGRGRQSLCPPHIFLECTTYSCPGQPTSSECVQNCAKFFNCIIIIESNNFKTVNDLHPIHNERIVLSK